MSNQTVSMRTFQLQTALHRAVLEQIIAKTGVKIDQELVLKKAMGTIRADDQNAPGEVAFLKAELDDILP